MANVVPPQAPERERRRLAKIRCELARLRREAAALDKLAAQTAEFERALDVATNWPPSKPVRREWRYDKNKKTYLPAPKYRRRPTKWMGRHGYEFVAGVLDIQARENCSIAAAIRKLKKDDAKKWPEKQRDLERRFQEIGGIWGPWCEWRAALRAKGKRLMAKSRLPV